MEQTLDRGIAEYNPPLETNIYDWQLDHLDCDAIFTGNDMRKVKIFYYATSKTHNDDLYSFMREKHGDKKIMMGLSEEEVGHVD